MPFTPVLYTNESADSEEAKKVLRDAGIPFNKITDRTPPEEWKNDHDTVPRLITDHAFCPGIELIRWYAKSYASEYSNIDSD